MLTIMYQALNTVVQKNGVMKYELGLHPKYIPIRFFAGSIVTARQGGVSWKHMMFNQISSALVRDV
jgi:hypothetical protein